MFGVLSCPKVGVRGGDNGGGFSWGKKEFSGNILSLCQAEQPVQHSSKHSELRLPLLQGHACECPGHVCCCGDCGCCTGLAVGTHMLENTQPQVSE